MVVLLMVASLLMLIWVSIHLTKSVIHMGVLVAVQVVQNQKMVNKLLQKMRWNNYGLQHFYNMIKADTLRQH